MSTHDIFSPSTQGLPKIKRHLVSLLVAIICCLALNCPAAMAESHSGGISIQPSEQDVGNQVVVSFSNHDNATLYSVSQGDCSITWIAHNAEPGIITHRAACEEPLAVQIPLITKICAELFGGGKNARDFQTLFWGKLETTSKSSVNELSCRLALAAAKSSAWDSKHGKPKKGDLYRLVKDLSHRFIYPELKDIFSRFGKNITLSSIEKVRILEAGKLPFYGELEKHGIEPAAKLPFDFVAWFSVEDRVQKQEEDK